jgi:glycosyltransferase involved in cell wall biosynthesis
MLEVHLDEPLPRVEAEVHGRRYARARVLVRLHRRPLGVVELDLGAGAVDAERLAREARAALGKEIDDHLAADGLPPAPAIPRGGLEPPPGRCADDATPAGRPFVSVVIATRDRPQLLEPCLKSVLAGSYRDCEVLVVDNAPRDGATRALVEARSKEDARVRYLVEPRPGAGVARNHGLARAKGEIVAFLDDDLVADRHWLEATVGGFHVAPGVACVTALIMPLELETPAQHWLEEYGGFGKGFRRKVYDLGDHRQPDRLYPYSAGIFGSGASMAFATARLLELGGFDRRLARSGEDLDLFLKVLFAGGGIVYEPGALVWHRHPREYEALRRTMFNYGAGLSGLLTKWALSRPTTAAEIALRLPAAARLALDPRSRKNAGKRRGYPKELSRRELAGMALGPGLYLRAAWRARTP